MSHLLFEWDESKTIFTDQFARLIADPDNSDGERFVLLGTSINSKLLVVCHCIRSQDSIRIISVRKADKHERFIYEEFRHA